MKSPSEEQKSQISNEQWNGSDSRMFPTNMKIHFLISFLLKFNIHNGFSLYQTLPFGSMVHKHEKEEI
jgi:hypothetical protein